MLHKVEQKQKWQTSAWIKTKKGKYLKTYTFNYHRIINWLKKHQPKRTRLRIKYAWGDNQGIFCNLKDALQFIKKCREDYNYFTRVGY